MSRGTRRSVRPFSAALLVVVLGCKADDSPVLTTTATAPAATAAPRPTETPSATATVPSPAPSACPSDMVEVKGDYCPRVKHTCLQHSADYEAEQRKRKRKRAKGENPGPRRTVEICLRYAEGECLSKKREPMRFCMDRYEWPGKEGELPLLLVTWKQAKALCEEAGKRLCTADEFNFACEGEAMLPYSYGLERDPKRCNQDKPYVVPEKPLPPYDHCFERKWCKEAIAKLDQREPIGSRPDCTSPFGAFHLNGNVNEWVERPGKTTPWRSGLKGGWWGPARSRCRPMVIAHDENYSGYEVGFRCCSDAQDPPR